MRTTVKAITILGGLALSGAAVFFQSQNHEIQPRKSLHFSSASYVSLDDIAKASESVFIVEVSKSRSLSNDDETSLKPLTLIGATGTVNQVLAVRPDADFKPMEDETIALGQVLLDERAVVEYANSDELRAEIPLVKDQLIRGHSQLVFGVGRVDSAGQKYVEVVASAMAIGDGSKFKFGKIFGSLSGSTVDLFAVRQAISNMSQTPSPWKPQ